MTRKTWIIFIVLCVAIVGGLVWMGQQSQTDVSTVDVTKLQQPSEDNGNIGDRVYGTNDAKVTLIEYGDYQCPGCASASPALLEVAEKYKDEVTFVFRNFPLPSIHPNARAAAAAAEAAGQQDKFWEMHELLYQNQDAWASLGGTERATMFQSYAESLDIDIEQWNADVESSAIADKINYDSAIGRKAGVSGTPAIYLNGEKVDQYAANGELVSQDTEGAAAVWTNAEDFENLIIIPALEEAGIEVDN